MLSLFQKLLVCYQISIVLIFYLKEIYKINTKSFESNFILARSYYFNELYSKARKYAKLADNIKSTNFFAASKFLVFSWKIKPNV